MVKRPLDNLVATGALKAEARSAAEIDGLIRSGEARLNDAANESLSIESRFDLAYNAAHALSLAALRWHGYRPDKRYIVFQALAHTVDLPAAQWRVLESAHRLRNTVEYEGLVNVDKELLDAVLRVTHEVATRLRAMAESE
ncbi:MAG: hypothetical protein QOF63_825 [Thermoanaerobaculia bacterium]|jgi:hypothetical protein|nr:hypothetical protein [Thermoanaerobaculia bacterium]